MQGNSHQDRLELTSVVARSGDQLSTTVDGQVVLRRLSSDRSYGLNPTSTRIWELLERPRSVGELCRRLEREFAVDPRRCRSEVLAHLAELAERGLVEPVAGRDAG